MAVSKIWNVNSRLDKVINYGSNEKKTTNPDYDPLKTVLGYGDNPDKTEKQLYSTGINCDAEFAYQQFVTVKMQYGKTDGILGYMCNNNTMARVITAEKQILSQCEPTIEDGYLCILKNI